VPDGGRGQAGPASDRAGRLLPDILSSRIYLKIENERAQALLEHWAEPWSALAWLQGAEYPQAFLWKSWEWLLQNQPHDSIGGCSIDAVHAQMETRFAWASEIAEEITAERFELLARQVDLSGLAEDEAALVVFNGLPWAIEGGRIYSTAVNCLSMEVYYRYPRVFGAKTEKTDKEEKK